MFTQYGSGDLRVEWTGPKRLRVEHGAGDVFTRETEALGVTIEYVRGEFDYDTPPDPDRPSGDVTSPGGVEDRAS